jgi:hypothetical protein
MKSVQFKCALSAFLTLVITAGGVSAQQQSAALISGMAANSKQLKQYTFKQRTETYHKGQLKKARIEEIHYNAGGERVSIPLDDQKEEPESRRRGPGSRIVARKMEQEQEKMKEYIERLTALTSRYVASDPEKLQAAFSRAEVTTGGGSSQVRIVMRDYVKRRDIMTMTFDSATKRLLKTEVTTSLDEDAVSIALAFDQVREGPTYPGKTVIKADEKQLELRIFTYDYRL